MHTFLLMSSVKLYSDDSVHIKVFYFIEFIKNMCNRLCVFFFVNSLKYIFLHL